ncbi:MAG: hypothetical protein KAG96_00910 [Ichthyobacteriaceae bacterium]|nr:hypothetical protein [Ichthyobacteriaceae bacterium]
MVIIGIYFVGTIFSFFIGSHIIPSHDFTQDSWLVFVLYSVLILLHLLPALKIRSITSESIIPRDGVMDVVLIVFSIAGVFAFVYLSPHAFKSLVTGTKEIREGLIQDGVTVLPKSIFTTISTTIARFYYLFLVFIYVAIIQKKSIYIKLGLALGAISYIVNVLAFSGRTGFILVGIAFLVVNFLFYKLLSEKIVKYIQRMFILFSVISVGFLTIATVDRFDQKKSGSSAFEVGVVGYAGMQPFIFNETINRWTKYNYGDSGFPFFKKLFTSYEVNTSLSRRVNPYEWQFGTFLTSYYKSGGLILMLFISLFSYLTIDYYVGIAPRLHFFRRIIIYTFYAQFMASGFFYFILGNEGGNKYILLLVILYLLSYLIYPSDYFKKRVNNKIKQVKN